MSIDQKTVGAEVDAFVAKVIEDAKLAVRVLRDTGTLSASRTLNFIERIPGEDLLVGINDPGAWDDDGTLANAVASFEGTVLSGPEGFGALKHFAALFDKHPEITTVVHVHTPYLGAWAQTHRVLPIRYAAAQRLTLSREIHPHIDRRRSGITFLLERLETDPHTVAVFEGNGGANVIGRGGLLQTAKLILFLEEGAKFQALAEGLGGSREFGPGTLQQQWTMTGLDEQARELGLIPSFSS